MRSGSECDHAAIRERIDERSDSRAALDRDHQSCAAHFFDRAVVDRAETVAPPLAELFGAFREPFRLEDVQRREARCARERVAAEGRAVRARRRRCNARSHGDGPHRHAPGDRLAQAQDVGCDVVSLASEPPPRATETGLDFVDDQEHAALDAQALR